ncbi:MAG: potassium channel family protein, partial [Phycisphaerae bacterium]
TRRFHDRAVRDLVVKALSADVREKKHSLFRATYYTWSLIFGEPPEAFPDSTILRILFFVVPVLGLTVIIEGMVDFAFLIRDRRRFERSWCQTMTSLMSNHIVLVGFGRLGFRTFRLLRRLGEQVVVVEKSESNRFLEELRRDGSPLIIGDARDDAVLRQANVEKAKSVILATNDDLANLEFALDARKVRPDIRVVLRMFDQNMADKIRDGFDIHQAMSQSAIAAPAFCMSAIDPKIINSFVLDGNLIVMYEWEVREAGPLANKSVAEVMRNYSCGVIRHHRAGETETMYPSGEIKLLPGDSVILQGPLETYDELKKRLE